MIYVLTHTRSKVLPPIGELFCLSLKDNGYDVRHIRERSVKDHQYKRGDICIIIGAGRFPDFNKTQKKEGITYVLWQSEVLPVLSEGITPLGKQRLDVLEKLLPFYDYYFDYSQDHIKFMESRNWKIDGWVPIGYHESLDYTNKVKPSFNWDVLFVGATKKNRRLQILESIGKRCKVYPKTRELWKTEEICPVIMQTKAGLNIHYEHIDTFELWRLIRFICNKRLVISEPITNSYPLIDGEHFISAPRDEFVDTVSKCIADYDEFKKIGERGYDFIKNNFRFNDVTKKMIEGIAR